MEIPENKATQEDEAKVEAAVAQVVVEAKSPSDAEERVQTLVDNGDIDGVEMRGTLKSGGYDRSFTCQGETKYKMTVGRSGRRQRERKNGTSH